MNVLIEAAPASVSRMRGDEPNVDPLDEQGNICAPHARDAMLTYERLSDELAMYEVQCQD